MMFEFPYCLYICSIWIFKSQKVFINKILWIKWKDRKLYRGYGRNLSLRYKIFPLNKLVDKYPIATLLQTKSKIKLFQVSEYLKYKGEISKPVDTFIEELRIEYPELKKILPRD